MLEYFSKHSLNYIFFKHVIVGSTGNIKMQVLEMEEMEIRTYTKGKFAASKMCCLSIKTVGGAVFISAVKESLY